MGVDAEGEAGIGVAEVVGDGPDGLAGVDEHEAQKWRRACVPLRRLRSIPAVSSAGRQV